MLSTNATSTDRHSQVHTEVRMPIEAVVANIIWFIFGVIEVLIAIRFVFLLLGANPAAGFVSMIYGVSGIFMAPFVAIFRTQQVATGTLFEWSALVAIAVYALAAWGIVALIFAVSPRASSETVERVEQDDSANVR